jgi:hypothetical protein
MSIPELPPRRNGSRRWVFLETVPSRHGAAVLGVTEASICNWRAGRHTPRLRNRRKLVHLRALLFQARAARPA